jgi:carbon storage regulator
MLVLSRKKDESIVINNDITIVVVEIRGDKVRLGVEAPKEVPVHRREVFEAIAQGRARRYGVGSGSLRRVRPGSTPRLPPRPTLRPARTAHGRLILQRPPETLAPDAVSG